LLPIRVLLVTTGAIDLTQHAPELLGFGVPRIEQLRFALDAHPTPPVFGDRQHGTTGVATQMSRFHRRAADNDERRIALVCPTDDDAGVHGAVGPVCSDDAAMMALQKRTCFLEFHGFSSCSYPSVSSQRHLPGTPAWRSRVC